MKTTTEQESLAVAEAARDDMVVPSFIQELFMGNLRLDLIDLDDAPARPEFVKFYRDFEAFLKREVDPALIDATGEYPTHVLDGLRKIGAFGLKIPKEYGGLGLNQVEYSQVMRLLGSHDANITALLSAHQSIGVPQPLKVFGTKEQKQKYLPRLAAGAISAFALTEVNAGSDPARMETTVTKIPNGNGDYYLNGKKLWCTNGTLAEIIVVMAKHQDTGKLSAFIVETQWAGFTIEHRCRFMGLKALGNAVLNFDHVRIPKENLIGAEGQGLKIALTTLNTGRLSLPAAAVGIAKKCLEWVREWSADRVQWGRSISEHEAISHKISRMVADTYAMDAVSTLSDKLALNPNADIRLEAAAAKEFNTVAGWHMVDDLLQIRGGRGYENERSLAARGEKPIPVERIMRDYRINLIFEGSSEIMHLFMAREAVGKHIQIAGDFMKPKASFWQKTKALGRMAAFYSTWYPSRWFGWGHWPRFSKFGKLARHMQFVDRSARKLARTVFYKMVTCGPKLQHRQATLFRLVDVVLDLYAMSASIMKAHKSDERAEVRMADAFCRMAARRIDQKFADVWDNDDKIHNNLTRCAGSAKVPVCQSFEDWLESNGPK